MSNDEFNAGYAAGLAISCNAAGVSTDEFMLHKAASDAIREDRDAQVTLCKVAKAILTAAGEADTTYAIYDTIEKSAGAVSGVTFDTYISPVLSVLGAEAMTKAAVGPAVAPKVIGGTISMGSDAVKSILATAAALGAAGGGAWWALNRDLEEDDVELQAKREQAAYYRKLTKDLKRKIAQQEAKDPRIAAVRAAVENPGDVF